jgi:hypothetical protein
MATEPQRQHTSSRADGNGALVPQRFSHCPKCGDVRTMGGSDIFECEPPCNYRACTHCHPEILITPGRGVERLLAQIEALL